MKIASSNVPLSKIAFALGLIVGSTQLPLHLSGQSSPPPAQATKPQRVRTQLDGFDLSAKSGSSPNQVAGASRGGVIGAPKLYAPASAKAFATNPLFQWAAPETNAKATFRLSAENGQVVYETSTTADHLQYPSDAPPLTPGSRYRWTIVPEIDVMGATPGPATFLIVSGAERSEIINELMSAKDAMASASVFVKHRIWYDAIQAYSEQIERMPNDSEAHAGRADLYNSIPATRNLSDADWKMVH